MWCHQCAFDWYEFRSNCGQNVSWEFAMAAYQRTIEELNDELIEPPAPQPLAHMVAGVPLLTAAWHAAFLAAQRSGQN